MKKQLPKGYTEYFEDLKEYKGLSQDDKDYIYRFYLENYNDKISFDGAKLLKSPRMLKVARKNHNSVKRDAMRVAHKTKRIRSIESVDSPENRKFMEDMSNEQEWRTAYKIGGYELAGKQIVGQAVEEIKLCEDDSLIKEILLDFLLSFRELRLEERKDRTAKREQK